MSQDLLSISPKPPTQGGEATICIEFAPGVESPQTVKVRWSPDGSETFQLTSSQPCRTVDVPANAESYNVSNPGGPATDIGGPVQS